MGKLTVAKIKALTLPGMYGDGGTLYLNVAPGGSKSWVQRVKYNGRRRDIGLGGFPVVSLAMARDRAFMNRRAIAEGRDPLAEKRKANVPTFRAAVDAVFEATRPKLRSAKAATNWRTQVDRHAIPILGDMPINQIGADDVLRVLTPPVIRRSRRPRGSSGSGSRRRWHGRWRAVTSTATWQARYHRRRAPQAMPAVKENRLALSLPGRCGGARHNRRRPTRA